MSADDRESAFRQRPSIFILPLLVLGTFILVAVISFFYTDWLDRQRLILETTERAISEASRFTRQANVALGSDAAPQLEQEIMLYRSENYVSISLLTDPDGNVLFAPMREWRKRPVGEVVKEWDAARFQRVVQDVNVDIQVNPRTMHLSAMAPYVAPPIPGQSVSVRRGVVFIVYDLSSALEQVRQNNFNQRLPDLGLVLLLAIGLAFWVHRRVVRPLQGIAQASRKIGNGDLHARAPVTGSRETAELGDCFNHMAISLENEQKTRNQLNEQIQQSYDRLSRLTAQIPGVVYQFLMSPEGQFSMPFVSEGIRKKYQLSEERLAENAGPLLEMIHPEDRADFTASILESARTLQYWQHEFRVILPNGRICWHSGSARVEKLEEGSVQWHGFLTDITERRASEEHNRLSARIFETTGEAIVVTDASGNIVMVNPAFSRITGYEAVEVLEKDPRLVGLEIKDDTLRRSIRKALLQQGNWAGEVRSRRKNGEEFPEWQHISVLRDDTGRVTHYVTVFSDLTEIHSAQEKAELLSWRDPLTGLANRALFLRQVEQTLACAQRDGGFAAILIIDLDRFKDINEARGLAVGDQLLKSIAERLTLSLRPDDVIARLNADEFAVILPQLLPSIEEAGREALAVAEKLRAVLQESLEVQGETFHLDACIGIAFLPDASDKAVPDALRRADMAMHQAKTDGGARIMFFESAMGDSVRERFRLERELRAGIPKNQLRLYLQPQVDHTGRLVGSEALVRWQHPELGLVQPVMFIPLAEATDLIVQLDRWVLNEVCHLLTRLEREGRAVRISVNISPRHFRRDDFVDEIKRVLTLSGASPQNLILEVTEGMVIGDIADVVAKMNRLTAMGIHFSMDDFGTGYSSLSYLKRLPIQELKIDKSFIQDSTTDASDAALVETILSVAQHLNLQVVAEGIETREQADFLNARATVIHQGNYFGRPDTVENWMERLVEGGGVDSGV